MKAMQVWKAGAGRMVMVFAACTLLPATGMAQSCQPAAADWISALTAADALAAPVRPADCSTAVQSPPDFGWPDLGAGARYALRLTYPDGRQRTLSAPANWLNWDERLAAGSYAWQIEATDAAGTRLSQPRRFTVPAGVAAYLVPPADGVHRQAAAKARPRTLPDSLTWLQIVSQRTAGFAALRANADAAVGKAPPAEPLVAGTAATIDAIHEECKRTQNAAMAWVTTREDRYFQDALARLKNLAAWSPSGTTGYNARGMRSAAREIAWTLVQTYDWLYPGLDSRTRRGVLDSLKIRVGDLAKDVGGVRSRLAARPLDSQGAITLTVLASASAVLAGDLPETKAWLAEALPLSLNLLWPWSGPDGGNAQGTAHGHWDVAELLVPWYALRWAAGVDVGQKPWLRNWNHHVAYFLPPGTPSGSFGDGAEATRAENWSRFAKGATWLAPTPLARWYVAQPQLQAEDPARLELLLAPPADTTTAAYPAGTPNAAVFPGIGWAAFHSDLARADRTSVYFKSSPFGSVDHGHADQNSFVINAGGERLAIDSGLYDAYNSAHWRDWYKQTRAHNAITFDGGQGQAVFETGGKPGRGRLLRHDRGADYEIVYGDATDAYGGALTQARRALVYLPPNLVLVYDQLASATGRQWEWNLHALEQMTATSGTTAKIVRGTQSLCVNMLGGVTTAFRQDSQYVTNPSGSWTPQWHGSFYSTARSPSAEFIALLNVGCVADSTTPVPTASRTDAGWKVNVGKKTLTIAAGAITVAPLETAAAAPGTTTTTTPAETTSTTPATTAPVSPTATPLTLASTGTRAVATFHSLGAYWTPGSNPGTAGCRLQFKRSIDTAWREALPMWYDARNGECRGSVVQLQPGTGYDLQFSLPGQAPSRQLRTQTWAENFPVAKTVTLPPGTSSQMLTITQGGTAAGYVLYTTDPASPSTIDVANAQLYNVQVNAPYVIVRGLRLRGAQRDAIRIAPNVSDVIIEDNDIAGWGRSRGVVSKYGYTLGVDMDSAVGAGCTATPGSLVRVVVQRNRIHEPRYGANSWSDGHPAGPQGITFNQCGGNHVFRYNEITSTTGHYYNDAIGGAENFSTVGFPNADTDIYGNLISQTWDDGIESEGANRNVRIWGNYIDQTTTGIASTPVASGPIYIFRNVYNRSRQLEGTTLDADNRNAFAKSGSIAPYGGGRRYLFHNTLLQARQDGVTNGLGAGTGVHSAGTSVDNTVSRNNIYHLWKASYSTVYGAGSGNDFGYELHNGPAGITMSNDLTGTPTYATGNGWVSGAGGLYQLAPGSLGYDKGVRLPNFNDSFTGTAPDIGAHEANTAAMSFGLKAGAVPPASTLP